MTVDRRPVALITGSGRGIGRATALALAPTHDVVVHFRRDAGSADHVAAEVQATGAAALVCRAELEDPDGLDTMVQAAVERFGAIDVLVANAASGAFRDLLDSRHDHSRRTMETIVTSFVHLVGGVTAHMPEGGRIVAISGSDAAVHMPAHALIGAAKAALESLVRNLAVELGGRGITANAVRPGPIATDSSALFTQAGDDLTEVITNGIPAGRFGRPEEVAAVVRFLCSREAAYVSGAVIPVDGGAAAGGGPWSELGRRMSAARQLK